MLSIERDNNETDSYQHQAGSQPTNQIAILDQPHLFFRFVRNRTPKIVYVALKRLGGSTTFSKLANFSENRSARRIRFCYDLRSKSTKFTVVYCPTFGERACSTPLWSSSQRLAARALVQALMPMARARRIRSWATAESRSPTRQTCHHARLTKHRACCAQSRLGTSLMPGSRFP
jgi:hypothetical protein